MQPQYIKPTPPLHLSSYHSNIGGEDSSQPSVVLELTLLSSCRGIKSSDEWKEVSPCTIPSSPKLVVDGVGGPFPHVSGCPFLRIKSRWVIKHLHVQLSGRKRTVALLPLTQGTELSVGVEVGTGAARPLYRELFGDSAVAYASISPLFVFV
jgi:hypothetical protein